LRTPRWNRCRRNAPHELRQHDQVENPHILFGPEPVGANHDPGIEFAPGNDFVSSWIGIIGAIAALRRRAAEGGRYRVRVSPVRVLLWLPQMGIFDNA
jgi:hypothetical protein